ncbi:MAG TPA: LuxR C-terminal-related transcriptional regulator [Solirubrobacteraceae bacterium]|nr:LuxR C-terminal-related transcriptional regulator [Solirubrobacteraceae bacterium]
MQRLSASDLEGALRFVAEASAETGSDPFPVPVIEHLRRLVRADWASYCELDRRQRRDIALVESPVPDVNDDEDDGTFWRIVELHPLCQAQRRGRFDALKLSDFHTRRELHRLEIYADWFRPVGIECELEVGIPSPLDHTKTFLFDNERRDFTERDRALLNLLQPHFTQLYRAAAVRRLADTARAVIEDDGEERGIVVLAKTGAIEMASPLARRLLGAYFPRASGARLPRAVASWLRRQPLDRPPTSLSVDGPCGTLTIDLDRRGGLRFLLLQELAAGGTGPAALSVREREVLALVRDGLRNAEIAEALWVSPATVRKHLENIYEKLDVHTRTAAVARVHGLG